MFKVSNIERLHVNTSRPATAPDEVMIGGSASDVADTFLWRDYHPQAPGVQISTDELNFDWADFRSAGRHLRVRYRRSTGKVTVENCDPGVLLRHYVGVVNALCLYRGEAHRMEMATSIAEGIPSEIRERLDAEAAELRK